MGEATGGVVATTATDVARDVLGDGLTCHTVRPARDATTAPWPAWVDPVVREHIAAAGVVRLWRHQAQAADLVWNGSDVVLATGTASGKSLAYLLPALTAARAATGRPRGSTLYLAPTKALAADQAAAIERLAVPGARAAVVDGDSTREERDWARQHADVVLTNPDMLHRSLLPSHRRWAELFGRLGLVVVDESHHYRGLFGSHVAWVLRRLQRVAAVYGGDPRVLLLSATMADPADTGRRLAGRALTAVTTDSSPTGPTDVLLADTTRAGTSHGRHDATVGLLSELCGGGHQTIAFLRSRQATESVAADTSTALRRAGSDAQVAAYRSGYLPDERRLIERRLRTGELAGVAATTALELGVDIAGMDAVVVSGWPGTRAGFWQQAGRAGRGARGSLAVFLAGADPLEQYVAAHPDVLIGAPLERTVIDPANPFVVAPQVCAAAAEAPWRAEEVAALPPDVVTVIDELTAAGTLRRRADGWYWPRRERPAQGTDIRGGSGAPVRLVEVDTGRLLGTVDAGRAPATVHPGAVYVHQGAVFVVTDLDLDESVTLLVAAAPDHTTQARSVTQVRIVAEQASRRWGDAEVAIGVVDVTSQVIGYQKRHPSSGAVLAEVALDMPEQRLRTAGCWWTLPDELVASTGMPARRLPGAAHAAEHASIGMLPLFATCDRWDVGGVSTARHPDTDRLTVVVHDAAPGGAGFAARGYDAMVEWLTATRDAIGACPCEQGCPSCVQSPKCGNGNSPLDKAGAVVLLTTLLSQSPG
ncbi:MAG: DEAD/DEAH box helicase [Jiangellales bacterium]